jgi:hypothetical protein
MAVTNVVTGWEGKRRRETRSRRRNEGKKTRWRKGNVARIVTKIDSGVTNLVGSVYHERADMHWTDARPA